MFLAKINDTVTFGEEEEDDNIIEFDEVGGEDDIENVSSIVLFILFSFFVHIIKQILFM